MNLGELQVVLFKKDKRTGELLFLIGIIFFCALFLDIDDFGRGLCLILTVCAILGGWFEFWRSNGGCYLYDYGLKIIRWKRSQNILYQDIQSVTTCQKWRLIGINSYFISVQKVTYPLLILKGNQQKRLFFEANNQVMSGLYQCAKIKY